MAGMDKLQWRLDRDDAELVRDALQFYADDEVVVHLAPRAEGLAKWLDHRIVKFWGTDRQERTLDDRLQAAAQELKTRSLLKNFRP